MNEAILIDLLNRITVIRTGNGGLNSLVVHAKRVQRYLDAKNEVKAFEYMIRKEIESQSQPVADCDISRTVALDYTPNSNGK